MTRQVCLWVPNWPLAAAISEGLIDPEAPAVVHDARGVRALSPAAGRRGVRRGMRRRAAVATCPELVVVADDPAREARVFETVLTGLDEVIALPAIIRPGLVIADARGPARHCGGEWELAEALTGAVVRASGAEAHVGIAEGTLAAILAARSQGVVPADQTAQFLAAQPMTALSAVTSSARLARDLEELIELCDRFGIRTLADFLALPRAAVATRFGTTGITAYDLARGHDVVMPHASSERAEVGAGREYDPPLATSEAAAFAARSLAEELAERLTGRSCTHLLVTARTTTGTSHERTWVVAGADGGGRLTPAAMTDRVRWQLDAWLTHRGKDAPDGELSYLELRAQGVGSGDDRGTPLWGRGDDRERVDRALARLQSLAGISRVNVLVEQGGRDPRSRVAVLPAVAPHDGLRPVAGSWPGALLGPAPTVLLETTVTIQLFDSRGEPIAVPPAHRGWLPAPASYRLNEALPAIPPQGAVVQWAGPWPLLERWWEGLPERCYLQLVIADGPPLLVVGARGTWRIEGHYD